MRKTPFLLFALVVLSTVALSGCFKDKEPAFDAVNRSMNGVLLERAFPQDTWFGMQFSTLNSDQRNNFRAIVAKFADNPDAFRDEILKGVDDNLKSIDLSYVNDIAPVLGENGFRFLMGMSEGDDGQSVTHVAVTLENPDKGRSLLVLMEQKGRFLKKIVEGQTLYFNAMAAEAGADVFYFSQYEDVLFAANDEAELLAMLQLVKSEGAVSLWTQDSYQSVVEALPKEALFSVYMNSGLMNARREAAVEATGAVTDAIPQGILQYLDAQGIAFVATKSGLDFRGIAVGDREKIDANDATLNELKAKKSYLTKDMPANKLALYLESYNFAATLERQLGASGDASLAAMGLDPSQIDLSELFGKGYALALHQNEGFLPGLTLMVDVSDGKSTARQLLDQLDAQVTALVSLMEFQGGTALSGALSRETIEIDGEMFSLVRLNVGKMMQVYAQSGSFVLPEQLGAEDVVLLYGITKGNRLVLSTFDGWLENPRAMLSDDMTYALTLERLRDFKEGMVYVRFSELLDFAKAFGAFREALSIDATQIQMENPELAAISADLAEVEAAIDALPDDETDTAGVAELAEGPRADLVQSVEPEPVDWVELLKPLKSFAFSSEAGKYKVELGGVVVMEE